MEMFTIIFVIVGLLYMMHRDSRLVCAMEEDSMQHDDEELKHEHI